MAARFRAGTSCLYKRRMLSNDKVQAAFMLVNVKVQEAIQDRLIVGADTPVRFSAQYAPASVPESSGVLLYLHTGRAPQRAR